MLKPIKGTVRNGAVELQNGDQLVDGQRVLVFPAAEAPMPPPLKGTTEEEDLEFVRRCRGRLAGHLKAEDAAD